jgi:hypothetical protein
MCWYSADHAESILEAEAGQRLGIQKVYGSKWTVRESDLHKQRPTPVCLIDGTKVLFRFSELEQVTLRRTPEAEAVFRMLTRPKRDVFRLSDGHDIAVDSLPENLVFDVLEVPGKEELSAVLGGHREHAEIQETTSRRKSLIDRVLQIF